MKKHLIATSVLALAGCVTQPPAPTTTAEVTAGTKVSDSSFDAIKTLTGPDLRINVNGSYGSYLLRAFIDKKSGATRWQAYADIGWVGGSWRFYRTASFEGGEMADARRIDTDVRCQSTLCSYNETVGVVIPATLMKADKPLQIRLNSQRGGTMVLSYSPEYLAALINKAVLEGAKLSP